MPSRFGASVWIPSLLQRALHEAQFSKYQVDNFIKRCLKELMLLWRQSRSMVCINCQYVSTSPNRHQSLMLSSAEGRDETAVVMITVY